MTKGSKTLPMVIQRVTPVGKRHASLLFTVSGGGDAKASEIASLVEPALQKLYKGKVRLCEGAVTQVFDGARDIFRCFVALNTPTAPYETAAAEGWTNVSANLFADSEDNLWEVAGEGDDRALRRISNDDMLGVLEERRSRSMATAAAAIDETPQPNRHAFVTFFDTAAELFRHGLHIGSNRVYVPEAAGVAEAIVKVEPAAIIGVSDHDRDCPQFPKAPDLAAASKSVVLEYYRKLYGQNSEFYKQLKKAIENYLDMRENMIQA